ncbi:ribonuclease E/G [Phenylobacterium montanum]|uniref:Ribonuclease E/G n=1 Tax=Phenylobacterium montanum TaxID=2823693 RepID=A0A975G130_9CAUL|nr:ribonuclease E/G [Caulobacter sp. S6]QUD89173.1 ribonuclease E/G [Caulobacter sp. S6]
MSRRKLYLNDAPGERRGVVTLGGRPERLILDRAGEPETPWLGGRHVARLARIERAIASAFLDLGDGQEALLALSGEAKALAEGQIVEIEITAEARRGKLALARFVGAGQGAARALNQRPDTAARLQAYVPGAAIVQGREARDMADRAEAEVLTVEHALPGGGSLAIEPTRALVAVDVDLGARQGDARRIARQVNHQALEEAARLLRLKGLGGLVVIDLVGAGHDAAALSTVARQAFAPDEPGVALGPLSRFGLLQLAIPWRVRPLAEQLCGAGVSEPAPETLALRLLRSLEREAEADRGARLVARCHPAVAQASAAYSAALSARIGARFEIRPDAGLAPEEMEISPQ